MGRGRTFESCRAHFLTRVVISAHLDDAVLSAFSAITPGAVVVTVLAGAPAPGSVAPWDEQCGATDSSRRVEERRLEDRRALDGIATALHLELADAQYVEAGLLSAPDEGIMTALLRPIVEAADEVYAPAALDNEDHVRVRDAVLAVRPDATLYADLPYALRCGFDRPGTRRAVDVTLADDVVQAKLDSVRAYATQLPRLQQDFGDFVTEAALGRERFWPPA
jgi:LmbE family N-acetylglucosaminyl deacetylase